MMDEISLYMLTKVLNSVKRLLNKKVVAGLSLGMILVGSVVAYRFNIAGFKNSKFGATYASFVKSIPKVGGMILG